MTFPFKTEDVDVSAFSMLTTQGKKDFVELLKKDRQRKQKIRDNILNKIKKTTELPSTLLEIFENDDLVDLVIALDKSKKLKGKERVVFVTNSDEILDQKEKIQEIFDNMLVVSIDEAMKVAEEQAKEEQSTASYIG